MLENVERLEAPGLNEKLLIRESKDGLHDAFVCKFPVAPTPLDSIEREELTYHIGASLGLPILEVMKNRGQTISTRFSTSPYIESGNLSDSKEALGDVPRELVGEALAFYGWIGEIDRGTQDVLIEDGRIVFIDHGLSGPNDPNFISAHPLEADYPEDNLISLCFAGKESFFVEAIKHGKRPLKNMDPFIKDIEGFSRSTLPKLAREYKLIDRCGNDFRESYVRILQERSAGLGSRYKNHARRLIELAKKAA